MKEKEEMKMNEKNEQVSGIGTAQLLELSGLRRAQLDYLLAYGIMPNALILSRNGKGRLRLFSPEAVAWCREWLNNGKR
jgi:hypothetical protein